MVHYLKIYLLIDTDFQIILKRLTRARDSRSHTFSTRHERSALGNLSLEWTQVRPACITAAQAARRLYHSQTGFVVLAMCCLAIDASKSKRHAL